MNIIIHVSKFVITADKFTLVIHVRTCGIVIIIPICIYRYPFTVSKNHLLLVGSPSSWPLLLGALTWLVDVSQ